MAHWQSTVLRAAAANRTSESDRRPTGLPRLRSAVADYAASACITGVNWLCEENSLVSVLKIYLFWGPVRTVRPVRCFVTPDGAGRLQYSLILVHALHADSGRTTSVQYGGRFWYSFWTIWYIMKSDCKKAPNGICVTDSGMFDRDKLSIERNAVSAYSYASTQSDHSAIITPCHHTRLTQSTRRR